MCAIGFSLQGPSFSIIFFLDSFMTCDGNFVVSVTLLIQISLLYRDLYVGMRMVEMFDSTVGKGERA